MHAGSHCHPRRLGSFDEPDAEFGAHRYIGNTFPFFRTGLLFLSAFGMFYSQPLSAPFIYKDYLKRRLRTVLLPYLTWSLFYLLYSALLGHTWTGFQPANLVKTLWYGLAMYHIYFLVILLWFYLLMPLWRRLLRLMMKCPVHSFAILFTGNLIFNFYSSYIWTFTGTSQILQDAFNYRLNWVVFHYLFIFMFGAFAAEKFTPFMERIKRLGTLVNVLQILSAAGMLLAYWGVMHYLHYDALSAVYTVHQLSPVGMIYTATTMIFLLSLAVPPRGNSYGQNFLSPGQLLLSHLPGPPRIPQYLHRHGSPLRHSLAGEFNYSHLYFRYPFFVLLCGTSAKASPAKIPLLLPARKIKQLINKVQTLPVLSFTVKRRSAILCIKGIFSIIFSY